MSIKYLPFKVYFLENYEAILLYILNNPEIVSLSIFASGNNSKINKFTVRSRSFYRINPEAEFSEDEIKEAKRKQIAKNVLIANSPDFRELVFEEGKGLTSIILNIPVGNFF